MCDGVSLSWCGEKYHRPTACEVGEELELTEGDEDGGLGVVGGVGRLVVALGLPLDDDWDEWWDWWRRALIFVFLEGLGTGEAGFGAGMRFRVECWPARAAPGGAGRAGTRFPGRGGGVW